MIGDTTTDSIKTEADKLPGLLNDIRIVEAQAKVTAARFSVKMAENERDILVSQFRGGGSDDKTLAERILLTDKIKLEASHDAQGYREDVSAIRERMRDIANAADQTLMNFTDEELAQ